MRKFGASSTLAEESEIRRELQMMTGESTTQMKRISLQCIVTKHAVSTH
jgi:hypothetical protein